MLVVILWCLGTIFTAFFLCVPIRKLWSPEVPGKCISLARFYYGLQIPNIVTDVWIIASPFRELGRMDLTRRVKVGASAMFLLGTVTVAFDIVRLVVLLDLKHPDLDATFNLADAAIWTTIEPTVAIVTICIPSVRNLSRKRRQQSVLNWHAQESSVQLSSATSKDGDGFVPAPAQVVREDRFHWWPLRQ